MLWLLLAPLPVQPIEKLVADEKPVYQPDVQMEAYQEKFMGRPARAQVSLEDSKRIQKVPEGGNEYNIWYNRYCGESWKTAKDNGPAQYRCVMARDAGRTRSDILDPHGRHNYFCMHFARGSCHLGLTPLSFRRCLSFSFWLLTCFHFGLARGS
eukprot:m.571436 g.571436  ORF g.571436 m.571436 type:complete len:154 (+) comp57859_c0_seq4:759-1220(+)